MSEPVSQAPAVDQLPSDTENADVESLEHELVVEDLLVEEISIDGMCGVY